MIRHFAHFDVSTSNNTTPNPPQAEFIPPTLKLPQGELKVFRGESNQVVGDEMEAGDSGGADLQFGGSHDDDDGGCGHNDDGMTDSFINNMFRCLEHRLDIQ